MNNTEHDGATLSAHLIWAIDKNYGSDVVFLFKQKKAQKSEYNIYVKSEE